MTIWLKRDGTEYAGSVEDANEAKGTAFHWVRNKCIRCGGAGGWRGWPGFTCYRCGGACWEQPHKERLYTADRLAKLNATQAKKDAKRQAAALQAEAERVAAADVVRDSFTAANADLVRDLAAYLDAVETADPFLADLNRKLREDGRLSDAQVAAARKVLDRFAERTRQRASSQFVGEIGQRLELTLTVEHVIQLPSYAYGWAPSSIHLCRDEHGNRVVYTGSGSFAGKGATVRVKATVSGHEVYKDEQQTQLQRPKVLEVISQPVAESNAA